MSQHDSLRERTEQHKPKNQKSKLDDKDIYQAMALVQEYIEDRFKIKKDYPYVKLLFEKDIKLKYMVEHIKEGGIRRDFDDKYLDRTIVPDGGILYLYNQKTNQKLPLVIAEIKRQGTNKEREAEGKAKQATGNAIERLGKNLTGIKAMMNYDQITPFICFGWGCDFSIDCEETRTVLAKVSTMNEFYPLNTINVFKKDGNANLNYFAPVSMFFREERWSINEMANIMKEIAETSFRYWMF